MQTQRLHLVSGKGGVGKTTAATALALAEARGGARVLLVELNGRDRIAALLNVAPVGYALKEVFENLWIIDVNAPEAMQEYILMTLRFESLYKALFENRLVNSFLRLLPALGELTMLGKIWYHAEEMTNGRPRFDVIVVDAPATGHARALFAAPQAVAASVPVGPMRTTANDLHAMLTNTTRTQLHVVTTPEDMPVTEALELCDAARGLGMAVGPAVINQVVEPMPQVGLAAVDSLKQDPAWAGVPAALHLRDARQRRGDEQLQRLPEALRQGAVILPRLMDPSLDRAAVQRLAGAFVPWTLAAQAARPGTSPSTGGPSAPTNTAGSAAALHPSGHPHSHQGGL
jgi:anion-transporting  ArsA/GET3 family ATPase